MSRYCGEDPTARLPSTHKGEPDDAPLRLINGRTKQSTGFQGRGMNLYRTISAVAAAASIAAVITILPGASELVSAGASDRPEPPVECTVQAWPNYDAACIRDTRNSDGLARTVRVIDANHVVR